MSTPQAIAAVTDIMAQLAKDALGPTVAVTARPLDLARKNMSGNQINIFLYQISPNAAWRNQDPPGVRPGDKPAPLLLPLRLSYLITAYGPDDQDDQDSQEYLGLVMLAYNNNAILPRALANGTTPPSVTASNLDKQIESVRLTLQPLTLDDLSKLYGLQTNLRLTVAYEASVVLIDSGLPAVSALPVLSRGQDAAGVASDSGFPVGVLSAVPSLDAVSFPLGQSGFLFGDAVQFKGRGFAQAGLRLEIRHSSLPAPLVAGFKPSSNRTDTSLRCRIPDDLDGVPTDAVHWPPGVYLIAGALQTAGGAPGEIRLYTSAPLACPLLPQIVLGSQGQPDRPTVSTDAAGDPILPLLLQPPALPTQQVQLLLGGSLLPLPTADQPILFAGGDVTIPLKGQTFADGDWVRVRVDGVDSPLLVLPVDPRNRKFDPHLRLSVPAGGPTP